MGSAFTENPGNQCFVHSAKNCHACIDRCNDVTPDNPNAYYLPGEAFMVPGEWTPCPGSKDCGEKGIEDVIAAYASGPASALWDELENALKASINDVSKSVFDVLLASRPDNMVRN